MGEVYIVEACRSPIGKRGKGLAGMKPADLLGAVQQAALDRSGIEPSKIRPGHRGLCVSGRRADLQHCQDRLVVAGLTARSRRDDH